MKWSCFSHVRFFATPWIVACQAPPSMGFSRQHWSGLPFPSPEDLPNPEIEPGSPGLQADSYHLGHQGSTNCLKKKKSGFKGIFVKTSLRNTGSLLKPFPKPSPRDPQDPDSSQDHGQPIQDDAAPSTTSRKKKPNTCRAWERLVQKPALSHSTSALQSMVGVCGSQIRLTYLVSHHPCGASYWRGKTGARSISITLLLPRE